MSTAARLLVALAGGLGAAGAGLLLLRDQTTDSDDTGEDVGRIDVARGAAGLGARAVEVLSRHVGEHGQGPKKTPGYHRSPFIDRVNVGVYNDAPGLIGAAWCARAVRWAYETAAQELGQPRPFAKSLGALSWVSDWKKRPFRGHVLSAPKAGAVLLLGDAHATLIGKVIDERTVLTVEGNHGDAVANVRRTLGPKDTIVDVEAYVTNAPATVTGLGLLGAEDWTHG